jgi:hypothetical protein
VRVELGRVIALCLAVSLPPVLSSSCATGEEDTFEPEDGGTNDSSAGTGFSGSLGTGAGATGGTGVGGTDPGGNGGVNPGGTGPGGAGGTDPGGTGGTDPGGTGGQSGATGSGGTAGVSGSGGICNPAFCPNTGAGTPCCIMGMDTCGMDNGMGCVKTD